MTVTTDLILKQLKEWVENKQSIAPQLWLDACIKLNVLKSDETKLFYEVQQGVAKMKLEFIESGDSVAKAKAKVEASDEYRWMKIQEGKMEMVEEAIRISKIQARMGQADYQNQ